MKREDLIKEMRVSVGNKDPIEFFANMVEVFNLMFDKMESLEDDLNRIKMHSALAIQWEPKLASDLLANQIDVLRKDKEIYHSELSAFKKAYTENLITLNYAAFCDFWIETLGYHPFLDYK